MVDPIPSAWVPLISVRDHFGFPTGCTVLILPVVVRVRHNQIYFILMVGGETLPGHCPLIFADDAWQCTITLHSSSLRITHA